MKRFRKLSFALAFVMMLSFGTAAFADEVVVPFPQYESAPFCGPNPCPSIISGYSTDGNGNTSVNVPFPQNVNMAAYYTALGIVVVVVIGGVLVIRTIAP